MTHPCGRTRGCDRYKSGTGAQPRTHTHAAARVNARTSHKRVHGWTDSVQKRIHTHEPTTTEVRNLSVYIDITTLSHAQQCPCRDAATGRLNIDVAMIPYCLRRWMQAPDIQSSIIPHVHGVLRSKVGRRHDGRVRAGTCSACAPAPAKQDHKQLTYPS